MTWLRWVWGRLTGKDTQDMHDRLIDEHAERLEQRVEQSIDQAVRAGRLSAEEAVLLRLRERR